MQPLKSVVQSRKLKRDYLTRYLSIVSAMFALLSSPLGLSTTLKKLDIDEVINEAELVFEGEVLIHETRQDLNTGLINTYVTFSIFDVVKGSYAQNTIELKFAGGTFNGETVKVNGSRIPEQGEQGIYFVESTDQNLINPLVGWSQGHFIIKEVDGERIIFTTEQKPVVGIQSVSSIPPSIKRPNTIMEESGDTAAGVSVDRLGEMRRRLSVNEIKSEILEMIR